MTNARFDIQNLIKQHPYTMNFVILKVLLNLNGSLTHDRANKVMNSIKWTSRQSDILALRFNSLRVHTYEEIATELRITKGAVHYHMETIRKKINEAYQEIDR